MGDESSSPKIVKIGKEIEEKGFKGRRPMLQNLRQDQYFDNNRIDRILDIF